MGLELIHLYYFTIVEEQFAQYGCIAIIDSEEGVVVFISTGGYPKFFHVRVSDLVRFVPYR